MNHLGISLSKGMTKLVTFAYNYQSPGDANQHVYLVIHPLLYLTSQ